MQLFTYKYTYARGASFKFVSICVFCTNFVHIPQTKSFAYLWGHISSTERKEMFQYSPGWKRDSLTSRSNDTNLSLNMNPSWSSGSAQWPAASAGCCRIGRLSGGSTHPGHLAALHFRGPSLFSLKARLRNHSTRRAWAAPRSFYRFCVEGGTHTLLHTSLEAAQLTCLHFHTHSLKRTYNRKDLTVFSCTCILNRASVREVITIQGCDGLKCRRNVVF